VSRHESKPAIELFLNDIHSTRVADRAVDHGDLSKLVEITGAQKKVSRAGNLDKAFATK
jgi:hypothetical protein